MRVPLHWLLDWLQCDHPLDTESIRRGLEQLGIEIEAMGQTLNSQDWQELRVVLVQRIVESELDPCKLADVFDGETTYRVDGTASNCRVGMRGVLMLQNPNDQVEDPSKVASMQARALKGTLCTWSDLDLLPHCLELIELSPDASLGQDPTHLLSEPVWELSLTPNLGHCLSIRGLARELVTLWEGKVHLRSFPLYSDPSHGTSNAPDVEIDVDANACSAFGYVTARGPKVDASPIWLRRRLSQSGIQPHSPVVDVTNYVMLELGQPLHAYSIDALGGKLRLTTALDGQRFYGLNRREKSLTQGDLIAVGAKGEIASLAGIIGAADAEVRSQSHELLIEAAHFAPAQIQRTSRRLGLYTESAMRFERGCDARNLIPALNRAKELLQTIGIESVSIPQVIETSPHLPKRILCRAKTVQRILGITLNDEELLARFRRCNLNPEGGEGKFYCTVPSYRFDLREEVDIVAELARQIGVESLPRRRANWRCSEQPHDVEFAFGEDLRSRCRGLGFSEIATQSLIGTHWLFQDGNGEEVMGIARPLSVRKPKSMDHQFLRTGLLGAFLQVLSRSSSRAESALHYFEIARVYGLDPVGKAVEHSAIGLLISGDVEIESWQGKAKRCNFYHLKGQVESLLRQLGIETSQFQPTTSPTLHPGQQARICSLQGALGFLGQVHPQVLQARSISREVFFCQLSLPELLKQRKPAIEVRLPSPFPASTRDWTVTVCEELSYGNLRDLIPSRDLLFSVELLGIYQSAQLGAGRKNVTLRFCYVSSETTLAQSLVDQEHMCVLQTLVARLSSDLIGATLIPQDQSEKN